MMPVIKTKRIPYYIALPYMAAGSVGLIGAGIVMCITVLAIPVGLPMVFTGLVSLAISPITAFFCASGRCPECGKRCSFLMWRRVVKCRKCKNRLLNSLHSHVTSEDVEL